MTLLDIYEQVKLVKPEVFPFYIEIKYVDSDSTVYKNIVLDKATGYSFMHIESFVFASLLTDNDLGYEHSKVNSEVELLFLDLMMNHYMNPKDEHQYRFSNKFKELVK